MHASVLNVHNYIILQLVDDVELAKIVHKGWTFKFEEIYRNIYKEVRLNWFEDSNTSNIIKSVQCNFKNHIPILWNADKIIVNVAQWIQENN